MILDFPQVQDSWTIGERNSATVFGLTGPLTVSNRQQFKDAVVERLADGKRTLVIDFRKATIIDAAGLGVLVSIRKKVDEAGGTLELQDLNADLSMLFELTKLDTLFHITRHAA